MIGYGGEAFAARDLLECHRKRIAAGIRAVENVSDRALVQQAGEPKPRQIGVAENADRRSIRDLHFRGLVDKAHGDRITADELLTGIDPGIGSGTRFGVELGDQILDRVAGRAGKEIIFQLGQCQHIGVHRKDGIDKAPGLPGQFVGIVGAARILADRGAGAIIQCPEEIENVEAGDLQRAADILGSFRPQIAIDEAVGAVLDGANPPRRSRRRVSGPLIVQHAGQPGDRIAHARRGVGVVGRTEAVQIGDGCVLHVQAIIISDGTGTKFGEIGLIAGGVRRIFLRELRRAIASHQLDLVETVEIELFGDHQGFGNRDKHAFIGFEVRLIIAILVERGAEARQVNYGRHAGDIGDGARLHH